MKNVKTEIDIWNEVSSIIVQEHSPSPVGGDAFDTFYLTEAFFKPSTPGPTNANLIYLLTSTFNKPSIEKVKKMSKMGRIIERPYKIGQAADGTTNDCVMHLFWQFCQSRGLNASNLLEKAYPEEKFSLKEEDLWFAAWQGVEIIRKWDKKNFEKLIASITSINYHQLVSVLTKLK